MLRDNSTQQVEKHLHRKTWLRMQLARKSCVPRTVLTFLWHSEMISWLWKLECGAALKNTPTRSSKKESPKANITRRLQYRFILRRSNGKTFTGRHPPVLTHSQSLVDLPSPSPTQKQSKDLKAISTLAERRQCLKIYVLCDLRWLFQLFSVLSYLFI